MMISQKMTMILLPIPFVETQQLKIPQRMGVLPWEKPELEDQENVLPRLKAASIRNQMIMKKQNSKAHLRK